MGGRLSPARGCLAPDDVAINCLHPLMPLATAPLVLIVAQLRPLTVPRFERCNTNAALQIRTPTGAGAIGRSHYGRENYSSADRRRTTGDGRQTLAEIKQRRTA